MSQDQIKELLGEDFEAFQEFKTARDKRQKAQRAKELARGMVEDGGKYYENYNRLETQLDAIWQKAIHEANAQVGIVEEEKT